MNKSTLSFLFTRVKKQELTKEEAERKVCQEIFIAKIGSDKDLLRRVSFKGGLILDQLAKGERGYTKDIDFDFVKYPLSEDGLNAFFERLSPLPPYEDVKLSVDSIDDLRHKNYFGKRVTLSFSDGKITFNLNVDVGVHLPLVKGNKPFNYEIAFGGVSRLQVNPVERMIAEKLSTLSIYGTDNTRDKDVFDAYWLITRIKHDKDLVKKMLELLLVKRTHFFHNLDLAINEAAETLRDKKYFENLGKSRRNWTKEDLKTIQKTLINYLDELRF